jgi:hypothetical protein
VRMSQLWRLIQDQIPIWDQFISAAYIGWLSAHESTMEIDPGSNPNLGSVHFSCLYMVVV